jgi:hypothetical protein
MRLSGLEMGLSLAPLAVSVFLFGWRLAAAPRCVRRSKPCADFHLLPLNLRVCAGAAALRKNHASEE